MVDKEDRGVAKMETPSGAQETSIINESGLYSLIMSSKMEKAKGSNKQVQTFRYNKTAIEFFHEYFGEE